MIMFEQYFILTIYQQYKSFVCYIYIYRYAIICHLLIKIVYALDLDIILIYSIIHNETFFYTHEYMTIII